jgi:hypothetical protein
VIGNRLVYMNDLQINDDGRDDGKESKFPRNTASEYKQRFTSHATLSFVSFRAFSHLFLFSYYNSTLLIA